MEVEVEEEGSRDEVTFEEAIGALDWVEDRVHTMISPGVSMLIGADWSRDAVEKALRTTQPRLTGPGARAIRHGICVVPGGPASMVAFATVEERLVEIERSPEPADAPWKVKSGG